MSEYRERIRHALAQWSRAQGYLLPADVRAPAGSVTTEGTETMSITDIFPVVQDNPMDMTEEERHELHAQAQTLPCSESMRAQALALIMGKRLSALDAERWEVRGRNQTYLIDDLGCRCSAGQSRAHEPYPCSHKTAVHLYTLWQQVLHPGQAPLFPPPKTVEERLAAVPEDTIDLLTGEIPNDEEDDVRPSPTTIEDALSREGWSQPGVASMSHAALDVPRAAIVSAPVPQALVPRGPLALLAEDLATWGAQRDMIMAFIKERLKPGIDYGPVHVVRDCDDYKKRRTCTNKYHWSKDSLRKPGAEKVTTLLRLRPEFVRDQDTWEMLGSPAGVLCYRCLLVSPAGEIVGEGRAARDVNKQDYGDINKAIKMCEKSSQLDAVIRVAGISDVFTQDLEDMHEGEERSPQRTELAAPAGAGAKHQDQQAATQQRQEIWQLLRGHGFVGKGWGEAARCIEEWCGMKLHPDAYATIIHALRERRVSSAAPA